MGLQAKDRTWFVVSVLAAYLLLGLAASPLIHPYFRDSAFYAIEFSLAAFMLPLFAERLLRLRPLILLAWVCVAGYAIGAASYLVKWNFLDHRAVSIDHLESSILTANLWLMAIFTYCWVLLPLAVFIGRWIVNRLGRTGVLHRS